MIKTIHHHSKIKNSLIKNPARAAGYGSKALGSISHRDSGSKPLIAEWIKSFFLDNVTYLGFYYQYPKLFKYIQNVKSKHKLIFHKHEEIRI